MLHVAEAFIDKKYHPTVICRGIVAVIWKVVLFNWLHSFSFIFLTSSKLMCFAAYNKALEDALAVLDKIAMPIDVTDRKLQQ